MSDNLTAVFIIFIIFGMGIVPRIIAMLGDLSREKRQHKLEELRLKAQVENQVLLGDSVITANMTAELQSLREEVSRLRGEVSELSSKINSVQMR